MKKSRTLRLVLIVVVLAAAIVAAQTGWDWAKEVYSAAQPRPTTHPASTAPDAICLTWTASPVTTQTIQWRTSAAVAEGIVEYGFADRPDTPAATVRAVKSVVEDARVENDPVNHHFTAALEGLAPATAYRYRVGSPDGNAWSEWTEFTTAPADTAPFSFIYLGDAQVGLDWWGQLVHRAGDSAPDAAFYLIAGDLVNRGHYRNEWDEFFAAAGGVFDRRPVVPAIGNHDFPDRASETFYYPQVFALPENGPSGIPPEEAYSFTYGNALFVVLNSNRPAAAQREWLEQHLRGTDATWKFVMYHHPAYSSKEHRTNDEIQQEWCSLFDDYHVDIAFQGHDHAYMRTQPMRAGLPATSPDQGTVYLISVSGTKYYEMTRPDCAAVAIADTSTYQVIDIQTEPVDRLEYTAYTIDGKVVDQFAIEKEKAPPAAP